MTLSPSNTSSLFDSLLRGWRKTCPQCGKGQLFKGYLKLHPQCSVCQIQDSTFSQADDGPAYFTILIVGHIIVPLLVWTQERYDLPLLFHWFFWPFLTLILTLGLLPRVKGAFVGFKYFHQRRKNN